mmetsp:Transcript_99328/g.320343  ORF Transcript_99328/g.320343 Transcript_99328/m.320343 type:complete len:275 (-) Transcript_99328:18-842(-)
MALARTALVSTPGVGTAGSVVTTHSPVSVPAQPASAQVVHPSGQHPAARRLPVRLSRVSLRGTAIGGHGQAAQSCTQADRKPEPEPEAQSLPLRCDTPGPAKRRSRGVKLPLEGLQLLQVTLHGPDRWAAVLQVSHSLRQRPPACLHKPRSHDGGRAVHAHRAVHENAAIRLLQSLTQEGAATPPSPTMAEDVVAAVILDWHPLRDDPRIRAPRLQHREVTHIQHMGDAERVALHPRLPTMPRRAEEQAARNDLGGHLVPHGGGHISGQRLPRA